MRPSQRDLTAAASRVHRAAAQGHRLQEPSLRWGAVVSWVPHLLIPMLVALAFFRTLPRRYVMALAPLVWLQDLDYFSPGEHRVYSHNIFIAIIPLAAAALLWRRRAPASPFWIHVRQPGACLALLLASYYLASHILLDTFAGGVVLFWPLWDQNLYMDFEIYLNTATNELTPAGNAGSSPGAPTVAPEYPWLTYEHTAVLAFLAVVAACAGLRHLVLRRKQSQPPAKKGKAEPPVEQA